MHFGTTGRFDTLHVRYVGGTGALEQLSLHLQSIRVNGGQRGNGKRILWSSSRVGRFTFIHTTDGVAIHIPHSHREDTEG